MDLRALDINVQYCTGPPRAQHRASSAVCSSMRVQGLARGSAAEQCVQHRHCSAPTHISAKAAEFCVLAAQACRTCQEYNCRFCGA